MERDRRISVDGAGEAGRHDPARLWWARHPRLIDSLVAGCYLVLALLLFVLSEVFDETDSPADAVIALAIIVGTTIAVLLRRRWTVSMSTVVLALGLLSVLRGAGVDGVAVPIMLFSLAAYRGTRATALFLLLFGVLIVFVPQLPWVPSGSQEEVNTFALLLVGSVLDDAPSALLLLLGAVIAVLLGVVVRDRHRRLASLIERSEQREREQQQLARLAAATERARIARETHDIVSHTLTVVVTLADGAVAARDESRSKAAMTAAAAAARTALTELRGLLGALREDRDAPLSPQPDASALPALMEQFGRAGLPARLSVTGVPDDDPSVGFAIHRIVQEGLANALRYSRDPRRADVSIEYGPDGAGIVVENDGALIDAPSVGAGQGLLGLHERLDLLGGWVESGPIEAGVWRLRAWIPRGAPSGGATS